MTFQQELSSWNPFGLPDNKIASVPSHGDRAPSEGEVTFPRADGKPTVLTFLRHCGCPFAEKTFLQLRELADGDASTAYVAVSHSDNVATDEWLNDIGGAGRVQVIIDTDRKIYAAWGLGPSSFWHVLNPMALLTVYNTGKTEGIGVRPTKSGTRWQTAGSFAVDARGNVVWGKACERADDIPSLEDAKAAAKT